VAKNPMLSIGPQDAAPTTERAEIPLLEQATTLARGGDRTGARRLLVQLVEHEPSNEAAWIWLATVAEDGLQAIDALRTAHRLSPERARTRAALTKRLFREGVAAAQGGQSERARALLEECAALEPTNARTWLWLASTAPTPAAAIGHLRRALDVEPGHHLAQATLQRILVHERVVARRSGTAGAHRTTDHGVADAAAMEAEALAEAEAEVEAETIPAATERTAGEVEAVTARAAISRPIRVAPRASVRTGILPGFDALTHDVIAIGGGSAPDSRLVMVINSSPATQKSVAIALERYGHRVLPATDGEDALEKLGRVEPDLILLDVAAAPADGYRLCRTLRAKIGRRGVPVVVSGGDGLVARVRGWMAGATDSIAKPFAETALINVVHRHAAASN
jgi:CheY-like chemotaxis protein